MEQETCHVILKQYFYTLSLNITFKNIKSFKNNQPTASPVQISPLPLFSSFSFSYIFLHIRVFRCLTLVLQNRPNVHELATQALCQTTERSSLCICCVFVQMVEILTSEINSICVSLEIPRLTFDPVALVEVNLPLGLGCV